MKITFLGTASAHSYPLPFCHCSYCREATVGGGPSLRKRSSILINNDLLIDLGPDIMSSSFSHHIPLSEVRYCLQTHPHSDHLAVNHLLTRHPEYAGVDIPPLHFYASRGTLQVASEMAKTESADADLLDPAYCKQKLNLEIHEIMAFQPFDVANYRVIAFPANHHPQVEPLLYAVSDGKQTVFYGIDTAVISEETWQGFHQHNLQFDIVILDHTYGPGFSRGDHLDATQFIQHIQRMKEEGLLSDNADIFATHISHEGNPPHHDLTRFAALNGYKIAYDGLVI
jgi:phosphoribosyl 1,2-cyclic phosphate phosphodiesterase